MTNRIMELAYDYAASCERRELTGRVYARVALAAEVQAQRDYTHAVIAERDELKAENEQLRAALYEITISTCDGYSRNIALDATGETQ